MSLSAPPDEGLARIKRVTRGTTSRVAKVCLDRAAERHLVTVQEYVERTIGVRPSVSLALRQALFIFATQANGKRRG
jgi:hypothetical protein